MNEQIYLKNCNKLVHIGWPITVPPPYLNNLCNIENRTIPFGKCFMTLEASFGESQNLVSYPKMRF